MKTRKTDYLSTALEQVSTRLHAWKRERDAISSHIRGIVQKANGLLEELGNTAAPTAARVRRGGRPKGYRMSDATKAKLRAAWKRRKEAAAKR